MWLINIVSFLTDFLIHFLALTSLSELNTEDAIPSNGLTAKDFEKMLKSKIEFGLTLSRAVPKNNDERDIPVDIVEARKYVKHMDDHF